MGGTEFDINEYLIASITGLSTKGRKVYRDKKDSNATLQIFFKGDEEKKLERAKHGGYLHNSIKALWGDVIEELMRYITLEG